MKKLYFAVLILAGSIATSFSAPLQPLSVINLQQNHNRMRAESEDQPSPYIPALMLLDPDSDCKTQLEALGVVFYHERGNIHLTSIPRDAVNDVLDVQGIIDIACANTTSVTMDVARPFSFVDVVQAGGGDILPYTGKGVVTGISDIGFDPHHIAFRDNLKSYCIFRPEDNAADVYDEATMSEAGTDTDTQFHATHVGNILSGSYLDGLYYGVAPGADFVATTSSLTDVGILQGVEHIIDYARTVGKRAVINLSLSSLLGPHDGTSLMTAYLNLAAEDAVICNSAGNEGYYPGYAYHSFTAEAPEAGFGIKCSNNTRVAGYMEFWGSDRPFNVRWEVRDVDTGATVYASPWHKADNEEQETFKTDLLDGDAVMLSYLCPMNNRYNLAVRFNYTCTTIASGGGKAKYESVLVVQAPDGEDVYAYSGQTSMTFVNAPAGTKSFAVQCEGYVNDMNTAPNVISIGSCRSRNTVPSLSGTPKTWNYEVGTVSNFSSFASATPFCRALPDICGPGQNIVSALSSYYVESHTSPVITAVTSTSDGDYYWRFEQGTSMSSPYVAGVFALWLEADPTLTADELREIAVKTARTDFSDFPSSQWGAGCIDAKAGLDEVVRSTSGIVEIEDEGSRPTAIHTLSGILLPHSDVSALAPGLYIVTDTSGKSKKIVTVK